MAEPIFYFIQVESLLLFTIFRGRGVGIGVLGQVLHRNYFD
jgi:hypothetical protein